MNLSDFRMCATTAAFFFALLTLRPAHAEQPELVPRVMIVWGTTPLTWDETGSVALITTPKRNAATDSTSIGGLLTPTAVADTLVENRPDLGEELLSDLAELLESSLTHALLIATEGQIKFVATGGVEHPFVYFSEEVPAGAMAEAGDDGNILVLGEFAIRQKNSNDDNFPYYLTDISNGSWLILPPELSSAAEARVQIAVGLFTK